MGNGGVKYLIYQNFVGVFMDAPFVTRLSTAQIFVATL